MDKEEMKTLVDITLGSGLPPIMLEFNSIDGMSSKDAIAYRAHLKINSLIFGNLDERDVFDFNYKSDIKNRIFLNGCEKVIALLKDFEEQQASVNFITYKCNYKVLETLDIYKSLKELLDKYELKNPDRFCLEFDESLLLNNFSVIEQKLADIKLLKVKVLLTGVGSTKCPTHLLSTLPINYVILDPVITRQATNDEKKRIASSFIDYLITMGLEIIISDVLSDDEISKVKSWPLYGFVPSSLYVGEAKNGSHRLGVEDIL